MTNLTSQFRAARRCSTPLIAVRTPDAAQTVRVLREALNGDAEKVPLMLWDIVHGLVGLNEPGKAELRRVLKGDAAESTIRPDGMLVIAEKVVDDTIIFMSNAQRFWGHEVVSQAIWNLRDFFKKTGAMLIMLTTQGANVPAGLSDDVLVLDEPLPTTAELREIVLKTFANAGMQPPDDLTLTKAVDALIGLAAFPADQATAMSLTKKGLDLQGLWERKRQAIEQTRGLSVWRGGETFSDIGGCTNVKQFNTAVLNGENPPRLILFMDEIEKAFAGTGTDLSGVKTELTGTMLTWMQDHEVNGEIFIGPPGAAKSAIAKAIGNTGSIPTVSFDLATMESSLVGSSGENLRTALKIVEAMSQGRTLVIATCNSIGSLPPELRRRFTLGTFFFDLPTAEERAAIWKIYLAKYSVTAEHEGLPDDTGWTGAEIKECCRKAHDLRITLEEAAQYIVPVSRSAAEQINGLRSQASGKFIDAAQPGVYTYQETAAVSPDRPARKLRPETNIIMGKEGQA